MINGSLIRTTKDINQVDAIIKMYDDGFMIRTISKKMNTHPKTVKKILNMNGRYLDHSDL